MKGLNQRRVVVENGHSNEEMLVQKRYNNGEEDHIHGAGDGPKINLKVVHGSNQIDLLVPSQSTFGDLKKQIAPKTSLEPNQQRLLFRGKEKDDQECLHMAGVKDNAKLLLLELEDFPAVAEVRPEVVAEEVTAGESTSKERKFEEVHSSKLSKACVAVAEVRVEVDKLAEKVAALEAVVYGGTKAEEKEFIILSELLMRQLLKLDSIEAEGEGKVQRKLEVRRVQSLVDTVDSLKARNSNPLGKSSKSVSVTTKWETFDSGMGIVTKDWEQFD